MRGHGAPSPYRYGRREKLPTAFRPGPSRKLRARRRILRSLYTPCPTDKYLLFGRGETEPALCTLRLGGKSRHRPCVSLFVPVL